MKVKVLLKQLKGQYTHLLPFHTDRRNAIPWTLLGSDLSRLHGEALMKALGEKEVVDYKLGKWQEEISSSYADFKQGIVNYQMGRDLYIYFK